MSNQVVRAGNAFLEITLRKKLQAGLNLAAARLRSLAAVTSGILAGLIGVSTPRSASPAVPRPIPPQSPPSI